MLPLVCPRCGNGTVLLSHAATGRRHWLCVGETCLWDAYCHPMTISGMNGLNDLRATNPERSDDIDNAYHGGGLR